MFSILLSYVNSRDFFFLISVNSVLKSILIFLNRWGENIGSLQISTIQNTPNGEQQTLLWQRNETLSREWRLEYLNLRNIPYDFAMKFDGFIGSGWEGDVCRRNSFHLLLFSCVKILDCHR